MPRLLLFFFTALVSFGCMGMVNGLTGLDLEMNFDDNAVHPTDFVVSAPASAEKLLSMGMTTDPDSIDNLLADVSVDLSSFEKVRMDMISYKVGDLDVAMKQAVSEVEAAGFTPLDSDDVNARVYTKDGSLFVLASTTTEQDQQTLNLIRLLPRKGEPAAE